MLFMCHQMAMQREADQKRQQQQQNQQQQQQQQLINSKLSNNNNTDVVPIVWILGGPGSGKGTQCAKIVAKYNFTHLSTGDLLREAVAQGTEKGKEISEIMKRGELVPNELVLDLLTQAMTAVANQTRGYLIDGYPREKNQGIEFTKRFGPCDLIIYLECKMETMVARVLERARRSTEKRADDNEETIKERVAVFFKNTNLILDQYPDVTKHINGESGVDEIFQKIDNYLTEVVASKNIAVASN